MTQFARKCSYLNSVYFEVREPGAAAYEVEFRTRLSDYEASIYNGGPERYRADCEPRVRTLLASRPVSFETVTAFNEWCAAEHAGFLAQMRASPEKYGEESDWAHVVGEPFKAYGARWYADDAWHFQQA